MLARLRAVLAVTMLVGVFVLAAVVVGVLAAAAVWLLAAGGAIGLVLGLVLLAGIAVLVVALLPVVRATTEAPDGVGVSVMAEPALWEVARAAGTAVGTRSPDEIRLVAGGDAGVTEESRFLGLAGGIRVLHLGVPLLQTMTRAELTFVLAHELGHLSDRHVALSDVGRRGLATLAEVAGGYGPRHPVGRLLRGYLAACVRVGAPLWRRQELDADRWAAGLTGAEVGIAALHDLARARRDWGTFEHDYVDVAAAVGKAPRPLFAGYADFLSDPARTEGDADRPVDPPRSPVDTHPPLAERVEGLEALVGGTVPVPRAASDDDPALLVLIDPARTILEVETQLAAAGSLTPAPWEQVVPAGLRHRDHERALHVMGAVGDLTSGTPDLGRALHLVAEGGGRGLAERLTGRSLDEDTAQQVVRNALGALVRTALVGAGHASYTMRWDKADVVTDEAWVEVDVDGLVAGVPDDPSDAQWLLDVLAGEGIAPDWHPSAPERAEASPRADVVEPAAAEGAAIG